MKKLNKFLSIFLMLSMLLASATVVFAGVTVTSSVANDGYLKLGENVVLTFSEAISAEQANAITVTKVGDENNTNLVAEAAVSDTLVTLSFGDNLEYSTSYKITVPNTVTTTEWTSYFTTYNKYHRGIETVIVDENFNSMTADAVPAYTIKADADDIGAIKVAGSTTISNTNNASIKNVQNPYGQNGLSFSAKTAKDGNQILLALESYNNRIYDLNAAQNKVDGIVISYKFKNLAANLNDFRLVANSKRIFKLFSKDGTSDTLYAFDNVTGLKDTYNSYKDLSDAWHEYTAEIKFTDTGCDFVYVALDGNVLKNSTATFQNVSTTDFSSSDFNYIYLQLQEWTTTNDVEIYLDDIKIYEPSVLALTSVTAESTATKDSANVNLLFNNPVDTATLSNITVADEKGETVIPVITISNDLKTVNLTLSNLAPNTKYTVTVPNTVKDVFANAVTTNSFEFTTDGVANPQLVIGSPAISGTVAAGETLTATAALTENTTAENVDVTLAIALYNGIKLVDVKTTTQTFAKNTTNEEITVSLNVPNDIELKNYEARAFVLDNNLNSLAATASLKK